MTPEADWLCYPGSSHPLGATWDGSGVNFALFSENAERVELCLFENAPGLPEIARLGVAEQTNGVWHVYLPQARPGLLYGYRVYGPYDPAHGLRFNGNKLLLDPYARAITGSVEWSDAMFGYDVNVEEDADLTFSTTDSTQGMPRAAVIEPAFSWGNDRPPNIPWHETIIYEVHVKGFTTLNPEIPKQIRGTYAGLADHRSIAYLKELGVTAVELMPVHHFVHDRRLMDRGLRNYWGYNSIGFFAPDSRYSSSRGYGQVVNEFKTMVRMLHDARIEVILDVVYNHTGEGSQLGPTLSFRGIDNGAYYRLIPGDERFYMDYTGTGNTLNMRHPRSVQLIMDSLRYWVTEMHVDGFRFDLAATLARELHEVDRLSAFFDIIHQDPILSRVKLIAEPWDLGEGGYQVGNFPVLWTEWNGKYRDSIRRFWRGDPGQVGELAYRLTGSSDLYSHNGRRPHASINFITAHDGFTLLDLVSYNEKHNEANGERNADGTDDNLSWNCGAEGPTHDPEVLALRRRQIRNLLTTLLISQGVPMILHGDEAGRTQGGNNNAYCQDNETTWQSWELEGWQRETLEWARRVIAFRKAHPVLRRRHYFQGRPIAAGEGKDISWRRADGGEMSHEEWSNEGIRTLGVWLDGGAADLIDQQGERETDDTLVVLMNSSDEDTPFTLPETPGDTTWMVAIDTARPEDRGGTSSFPGGSAYPLERRSMAVLVHPHQNSSG